MVICGPRCQQCLVAGIRWVCKPQEEGELQRRKTRSSIQHSGTLYSMKKSLINRAISHSSMCLVMGVHGEVLSRDQISQMGDICSPL